MAARYDNPVISNGPPAREQGTCRVTDFSQDLLPFRQSLFDRRAMRRMLSPKDTIASLDPLTRNPQLLDRYGY